MKEIGMAGLIPFSDVEQGTRGKKTSFGFRLKAWLLPESHQIFQIIVVQVLDKEGFENSFGQPKNGKIEYDHRIRDFKGKNIPDEFQFQIDVEHQFNELGGKLYPIIENI